MSIIKSTPPRVPTWARPPTEEVADRLILAFRMAKDDWVKNSTAMAFAGFVVEMDSKRAETAGEVVATPSSPEEPQGTVVSSGEPVDLQVELYAAKRSDFRFCREPGAENYQTTFIRHLAFYPVEWRPIQLPKHWLQPDILSMALEIREAKAFDLLPIFADRFQDAGCDDMTVLTHLRAGTVENRFGSKQKTKAPAEAHAECWSCAVVELVIASAAAWERDEEKAAAAKESFEEVEWKIPIGADGLCGCSCGDRCPLGRAGMEYRCTREELEGAGIGTRPRAEGEER